MDNRTDVIRLLLQKGVDVNKRHRFGKTSFHATPSWNSPDATEIVVKREASASPIMKVTNQLITHGQTKVKQQFVCCNSYKLELRKCILFVPFYVLGCIHSFEMLL